MENKNMRAMNIKTLPSSEEKIMICKHLQHVRQLRVPVGDVRDNGFFAAN
jgi:hypothetical protein